MVARGDLVTEVEIGDHAGVKVSHCLPTLNSEQANVDTLIVVEWFMSLMRFLPGGLRTPLCARSSLWIYSRRNLPTILHCQSGARGENSQGCTTRCHRTRPLRWYYGIQRPEGIRCSSWADSRHRWCRWRIGISGLPIRKGHGATNHCHRCWRREEGDDQQARRRELRRLLEVGQRRQGCAGRYRGRPRTARGSARGGQRETIPAGC